MKQLAIRNIKHGTGIFALVLLLATALLLVGGPAKASAAPVCSSTNIPAPAAANSGSYSFSPASGNYKQGDTFTVTVNANVSSGPYVGVQPIFTFDTTKLQATTITTDGTPFRPAPDPANPDVSSTAGISGNTAAMFGVLLAVNSNPCYLTGVNPVVKVTFKVLASTGSTALTIANSSKLQTAVLSGTGQGGSTNIWNGVMNTATFTIGTQGGGGTGGSGGGTGSTGSTGNTGNTGSTKVTNPKDKTTTITPLIASNEAVSQPIQTFVQIVVTDDQGKAVQGAGVSIDGNIVTTGATGMANFNGLSVGAHTVKVTSSAGSVTKTIQVANTTAENVLQQFPLQVKKSSSSSLVIYIAAGAGVIIVGLGVLALLRQRAMRKLYGSYSSGSSDNHAVVSGGSGGESAPAVATTPAIVTPGQGASEVIKPTEPTEPTNK